MTLAELDPVSLSAFNQFMQKKGYANSKAKMIWRHLYRYTSRKAEPFLNHFAQEVAGSAEVSEGQLKVVLSQFLQQLEQFLAERRLEEKEELRALLAFEEAILNRREAYIQLKRSKLEKKLQAKQLSSPGANHNYLRFLQLTHEYDTEVNNHSDLGDLLLLSHQLTAYSTLERLIIYCDIFESFMRQRAYLPPALIDEILALPEVELPPEGDPEFSLILIYYHSLALIRSNDEASFNFLYEQLGEVLDRVPYDEQKRIVLRVQNFLTAKIGQGQTSYGQLYEEVIRLLLAHEDYPITEWEIKNFVTMLCRVGNMELAEELLVKSAPSVAGSDPSVVLQYNRAVIRMYYERYAEALELVSQIPLTKHVYYLGAKYLQLFALYKLNEYEGVLSLLESFQSYVRRTKWMTASNRSFSNSFAIFFRRLIKLKINQAYLRSEEYRTEMEMIRKDFLADPRLMSMQFLRDIISQELAF